MCVFVCFHEEKYKEILGKEDKQEFGWTKGPGEEGKEKKKTWQMYKWVYSLIVSTFCVVLYRSTIEWVGILLGPKDYWEREMNDDELSVSFGER